MQRNNSIILKVGTVLNQEESSAAKCAVHIQLKQYKPDSSLTPSNLTIQAIPETGNNSAIFIKRTPVDRIFFVSLDPGSSPARAQLSIGDRSETVRAIS